MTGAEHTIRVDGPTAERLSRRADELGLSVAELVALLAADDAVPARVATDQLAELDRRRQRALAPGGTVSHRDAVAWLETWGEASYEPQAD